MLLLFKRFLTLHMNLDNVLDTMDVEEIPTMREQHDNAVHNEHN
jgi:hypothetical protein